MDPHWSSGNKSRAVVTFNELYLCLYMREPIQVGKCILGHKLCQKSDKSRPHMQSVLTTRDTTNILLCPSHLTSHNDILWRTAFDAVLLTVYPQSGQLCDWPAGFREKCCAGKLGDPTSVFVVMCLMVMALSDFTV